MLPEVQESELKQLQQEHSALIKEYEGIIKEKIGIFTQMIVNLKAISEGNTKYISNEETIAEHKLAVEVWDRDIYQKKRVDMDVQVEIQNVLTDIHKQEKEIALRDDKIDDLNQELEDAQAELDEFHNDFADKEDKIAELEDQLNNLEEERARLAAEEEERRRLEEEERRNRPKPRSKYNPLKGDKIDERMSVYINNFELDVPLQRIAEGQYMFGTRKIIAKIMNDKLVIRVGGGFMLIDEFLTTYGQQELDKLQASMEGRNSFTAHNMSSPNRRGSPTAMWSKTAAAGRMSPTANRGSPSGSKQMKF